MKFKTQFYIATIFNHNHKKMFFIIYSFLDTFSNYNSSRSWRLKRNLNKRYNTAKIELINMDKDDNGILRDREITYGACDYTLIALSYVLLFLLFPFSIFSAIKVKVTILSNFLPTIKII